MDSSSDIKPAPTEQDIFRMVDGPAYIHVNLDTITANVSRLRQCLTNPKIVMVAMVKGNAYGHGMLPVAAHLKAIGVERLGVATLEEGIMLRNADTTGPIHVFGNLQAWQVEKCLKYRLIATIATVDTVRAMADVLQTSTQDTTASHSDSITHAPRGTVHIKVDTGMSRNGCQPTELASLINLCDELGVPLEGIFTHLANYEDVNFTKQQMKTYNDCIKPYRNRSLLFHVANSGGILTGVGTDLDMVRPGIALYGLSPGGKLSDFAKLGFRPAASVHAQTSLVKRLSTGCHVGYGCTYTCDGPTWVATIPVGYADGYWRHLSNIGVVIRKHTGERCPVIGRVSMDAITVKVSSQPPPTVGEHFLLLTADFDEQTSLCGITATLGTISYEGATRFDERLPRYCTAINNRSILSMTRGYQQL